ncbi:hypothetical protein [Metabacillus sp. RGM 3146]|uniref:hypothetical protein n=1 Tax=Metabacillus sp. RGM 3146 TaxID=3401092 RepID=UPI003B9B15A8
MKQAAYLLAVLFIIAAFFLNILGLMHLMPLYLTAPLLFVSIFILVFRMNHKKTFRGF